MQGELYNLYIDGSNNFKFLINAHANAFAAYFVNYMGETWASSTPYAS